MGYGLRDGDIISTSNEKIGALVHSVPVDNYPSSGFSPVAMWETQPAVRTVVDFITDAISLVPFDVYKRQENGGRAKDRTHRVHKALKNPAFRRGQRRWVQQLMHDMLLYGRWAFTTYPLDDGRLELLIIPAHMFSITADGLGRYQSMILWLDGGKKVERPLDDIVFDLNVASWTKTQRRGSTPVSTLEGLARESEALNVYRSELFKNSAMTPAVIERPVEADTWSDDAWSRFKRQFSTYRPGGGSSGGVPILEDGMKYKPIETFNPRDTQYVEVRQLALVEAAQALHIPPELVGAKDGTNSNIVALREQLYVDVLGSTIGYFEDALNVGLADQLGEDAYIEANVDIRLRATFTERVKSYQSAGGGPWMTRAEIRARENLEFLDGTEDLIVPMNVTEGGLASPLDTGQTNEEGGDPYKSQRLVVHPKAKAADSLPSRTATKQTRRKFEADVVAKGQQLRERWLQRIGLEQKAVGLPTISASDVTSDLREMTGFLFPKMKTIAETASIDVLQELDIEDWSVWSAAAQDKWLHKAAESWAEDLIQNKYADMITDAAAADPEGWQAKVLEQLGNESMLTAWAQTTGTELEAFGRNDGAKASGATVKTWRTTSQNPRESHAALNGATVAIDGVFPNGLRWPGDWTGRGPETANCACVLTYQKE